MKLKLSPSAAVAGVALFLALSGSAVAGSLITGKKVLDGSLTGADIKNRSLTAFDFKGSVAGPRGPQGAQGPAGVPGAPGVPGAAGVASTVTVAGPLVPTGPTGSTESVQSSKAECPVGTAVSGGGFSGGVRTFIANAEPSGNGYFVIGVNNGPLADEVQAFATCIQGPGVARPAARRSAGARSASRHEQALLAAARADVAAGEPAAE